MTERAPWTEDEDRVLQAWAGKESSRALGARLGRSALAVDCRCRALGIRRLVTRVWTRRELAYLRANVGVLSVAVMAEALGRTAGSVQAACTEARAWHKRSKKAI